ncbi:hypothetical protein [Algibacter lectus]|uniref:Uncharacterized protein n=1 Tax=Algibacter lectus TaxID=221126 RepID=A0A4R8MJC5_9FLAO|nr:hypothetical protein [Algibacter lectus]MWW23260.1 hypothetical protein [Algibacter lectus]TDY64065.1 hypothetical protein DFQ06_0966 [Algibacter lectus]
MIKLKSFGKLALSIVTSVNVYSQNPPANIVLPSNPRVTTDMLTSGDNGFAIGITSNGGGVINKLIIPGITAKSDNPDKDVSGPKADLYGRSGQMTFRDGAHSSKYNPTQAGFHERLGTRTTVETVNKNGTAKKLIVGPFRLALWRADNGYDFTENEIGDNGNGGKVVLKDPYNDDDKLFLDRTTADPKDEILIAGDNKVLDIDEIEEGLEITHTDEVGTPFTYYGTYEDMIGESGFTDASGSIIRHYYEARYYDEADHSLEQFRFGTIRADSKQDAGKPILKSDLFKNPATSLFPIPLAYLKDSGYKTDYKDLSNMSNAWNLRMDNDYWEPAFRFVFNQDTDTWVRTARGEKPKKPVFRSDTGNFKEIFMLTSEEDVDSDVGFALMLFRPKSVINDKQIVGRKKVNGVWENIYELRRTFESYASESFLRIPISATSRGMSTFGFRNRVDYLLNPDALVDGIREVYRAEYYIVYGTPKECLDNLAKIEVFAAI